MTVNLSLGHTALIRRTCAEYRLSLQQTAYVLATAKWETAHTMQPIHERGARAYFDKYEPGTNIGKVLGNKERGDGYLYRGRGFVQLTGRMNYGRAGAMLALDLLGKPDLALEPAAAAHIITQGMAEGWFTGKKLADYIGPPGADYRNARRIVNGTDKAAEIAAIAVEYEAALRTAPSLQKTQESPTGLLAAIMALLRRIFGGSK